jgi:hypothetical protein
MTLRYIEDDGVLCDALECTCNACGNQTRFSGTEIAEARKRGEKNLSLPCGHTEPLPEK